MKKKLAMVTLLLATAITATSCNNGEVKPIKTDDGKWIGWTYWIGGGKYGTPQQEEWMSQSYFLTCTEKQKVITVREFTLEN